MIARVALIVCLAWQAATVSAADTPEARAARFYAADLERPLLQIRTGAMLIQSCADRLRRACNAQQREAAVNSRVLTLLDALTLFPQRLSSDPAANISKARELREKIVETSAALLREAGDYDRRLFVRFGATLWACPDGDAAMYRESLAELERSNLTLFLAMSQEDHQRAIEVMAREKTTLAENLRVWPAEECAAARKLGEYLMELMHSKLQPWMQEAERTANQADKFEFGKPPKREQPPDGPNEQRDRQLTHAVAGNFVTVIATELELTAFPESGSRLKDIADEVQRAGQTQ
jgi:hypothetical protein